MVKRKKFIFIFFITAVFIFIAMQISVIQNLSKIRNDTDENNFHPHFAVTVSDCSIKLHPSVLSFPKKKLQKGDTIKITAKSEKWYRVIYYNKEHIKTGYIRANSVKEGPADKFFEAVSDSDYYTINVNAAKPLKIVNAYGNIKNYHPSVLYFKNGWNGYKYWMAYTPYENCSDYWENPHIAVSNDMVFWETPGNFKNPLEPLPDDYKKGISYNSDTELVYNTDTKNLECWWRNYNRNTGFVSLRRKTTANGIKWSSCENMLVFDLYKEDALSPALLYENGIYKMWSINQKAGFAIEYRESRNGKNWNEKRKIDMEYENPVYSNWHLDVIHTPKGYEMSLSANLKGTNIRTVMPLFYSYSPDNTEWSKAKLLLNPSSDKNAWDNKGIYRSCLLYAEDKYYLFYSGISKKSGPSGIGVISGSNVFQMR